jgi:hypothetical protein
MKQINIYSFHRNIQPHRFDYNNTISLINLLSKNFEITHHNLDGADGFIFYDVLIDHGSILIFEDDNTKKFKIYDFGDNPYLTVKLHTHPNFNGAIIGQYNPYFWNEITPNSELRKKIKAGLYPESVWDLGLNNFDQIQEYRKSIKLDSKLYWRGSLYNQGVPSNYLGVRKAIELLPSKLNDDKLYFGGSPIPFDNYIAEASNFKLVLSIGGGGGAICGDFCFRDLDMFGLGIPIIRPQFITEVADPIIPNYHYIAVEAEFDKEFRYTNPELLTDRIIKRYLEVINNDDYLNQIAVNAREWYIKNISSLNITNNLIKLLEL